MFNPGNMEKMMEQLGLDMEEIPAKRVVVETEDGKELVFDSPQLNRMEVQGETMFQLQGDYRKESGADDESDVEIVMDRTGASEEEARTALEENDDLTDAIMSLQ
ncbi:MAG: nascent polypeptide-associated complex protein [Candidatus Nanohaloarchaea archaeon]|nr:nascent polypeptide-associated complex protein [Candidatus Nanohaloarchaea archaeon]